MGKIYNYDTQNFIGGVAPEVAKHHGVKKGVKMSEHRPHEAKNPQASSGKPTKAQMKSNSGSC